MNKIAELSMLSHGYKRALILLIAGAIAGLSVPPLFILPALFIALPIWVWCLDGAEKRAGWQRLFGPSFTIGWFFGLGYFLVSLHWIGAAFFVDGGWLLALMPFAILALAGFLALFWGFASLFAHIFWSNSAWRILSLTVFLSIFELLRSYLFTGFPFNLVGYSLTLNDQMSQITAIIGIQATSFLAILLGTMLALVWPKDERSLFSRLIPAFFIIIILGAQFSYGQYRINNTKLIERTDIKLRLVQPAINQSQKWQVNARDEIIERLISLSKSKLNPNDAGINGVTYVIWPEAAIPFYLSDFPSYLAQFAIMLPLGKTLITGAPRKQFEQSKQFGQDGQDKSYNSILMINSSGEIISSYDKTHLVPLAEYLPFKDFFEKIGIKQFVPGNEGWEAGKLRKLMRAPGAPSFLPLICYEAIFSAQLGEEIDDADFILNLTNDGWFDGSIGAKQHFAHARIRAIEEGKSLVRVANTGITALVDPLGQVVASLKQGEQNVLDVVPLRPLEKTIFAQYKNQPYFIFLGFLLIILLAQKILFRNKNY
ncbi:MAG: apolipoprotein N-acyltransferase [Devosiaceae bacterium]|nr:apolipoprotein N-acyltransferase [Devosiaceae bacterium]